MPLESVTTISKRTRLRNDKRRHLPACYIKDCYLCWSRGSLLVVFGVVVEDEWSFVDVKSGYNRLVCNSSSYS